LFNTLQLAGTGGRIFIMMEHKHDYTEADIIRQNPALLPGGVGRPRDCTARHRVAVIVPYRDRQQHLNILLSHLHPMLQRQQLDYRIYVVEQVCTGGIIIMDIPPSKYARGIIPRTVPLENFPSLFYMV